MIPVIIGMGAASYIGHRYWNKKKKGMTGDRTKVYDQAMKSLKDPKKLRTLATAFEKEGLSKQADMLKKRAALRELPKETQLARRMAFKKGMKSTDPAGIEVLAKSFDDQGATGAAEALRRYATTLAKGSGVVITTTGVPIAATATS